MDWKHSIIDALLPKTKNRGATTFAAILILLVLATGCSSFTQPPQRVYDYFLEYTPHPIEEKTLDASLRIERFSISPEYNADQIIYREGPFSRAAYVYHRWHANPAKMVQYQLTRDFTVSGLFKGVFSHSALQPASFHLDGTVEEFLEIDGPDGWEASLVVTLTLLKTAEPDLTKRILFQKTFSSIKPCTQRHPRALAEAMSNAMADISFSALREVYDTLKNNDAGMKSNQNLQ